jgi:hypothetical protein
MPEHPVISEILQQVTHLHKACKSAVFCLVPGHEGLPWNETTNDAVKQVTLFRNLTSCQTVGSYVQVKIHCTVLSSCKMNG